MVFPTSPTVGQVFTSGGRSWIWNGSTWDAPTTNNALQIPFGLELVKTQTIGTAVTSVIVTDAFSAKYDAYKIITTGTTASVSGDINLRIGSATSGYTATIHGTEYNATQVAYTGFSDKFGSVGWAFTNGIQMNFDLHNPFLAQRTVISYALITDGAIFNGGGYLNNTTSYTGFTLTKPTGTISGGTIAIYGYRKTA